MAIFILFIPLIIFVIAEGVILYYLLNIIIQALTDYGYSSATMVDNIFPALNAILYVFILTVAIAVVIYLYIRIAIKPAFNKDKKKKTITPYYINNANPNINGAYTGSLPKSGNLNAANIAANPNFANYAGANNIDYNAESDIYGRNKKKKKKKKSKAPVIIIILLLLIIGAAVYMYFFQRDLVDSFIFGKENVENTTESIETTTEEAAEAGSETTEVPTDSDTEAETNTGETTAQEPTGTTETITADESTELTTIEAT